MNKLLICFLLALPFFSCRNSKSLDSTKAYFSAVDYLKAQVKQMDTVSHRFTKIESLEGTSDTSTAGKEEFSRYAHEFLSIPDIASREHMDDYTESNDFDEILNNVLLMYNAKTEDALVRSETIMMQPDEQGNTSVKTILINTVSPGQDSTVEKNMTWHIGRRFQIVTKINKPNQPEKIRTVIVNWE